MMTRQASVYIGFMACLAAVTVNVKGVCVDNVDCNLYGKETCTDPQYFQWARSHCARYCGFCTDSSTTQATGVGKFLDQSNSMNTCKDAISNCVDYGKTICSDVKFYSWTTENCKAHCNRCSIPCVDKVPNCGDYGTTLCTELSYYNWVEMNCRHYCARCT